MPAYEELETAGMVGAGVTAGMAALVVGLGVVVVLLLRRTAGRELQQMAEQLPRVAPAIKASELDMAVLIAVCEEKKVTGEQLAAFYAADRDRPAVVRRRFGDTALVRRFLAWPESQFVKSGYPAEEYLQDYIRKAGSTNTSEPISNTSARGPTSTPASTPASGPASADSAALAPTKTPVSNA